MREAVSSSESPQSRQCNSFILSFKNLYWLSPRM